MTITLRDARGPEGIVVYAIGDIHGRLDLLTKMHETIARDRSSRKAADWRVVHLGDYIDRGPDTRGVIDFLTAALAADKRMITLAGNHDAGLLEFLREPTKSIVFTDHGGDRTMQSYGVHLDPRSLADGRDALARVLPESHLRFLQDLKLWVEFGDFFFCHAGIRPGVPLEMQDPRDLMWIRQEFLNHRGLHDKIIVHGHTPSPHAEMMDNRVNVDTAAFQTGRLTALVIDGSEKQILTVQG